MAARRPKLDGTGVFRRRRGVTAHPNGVDKWSVEASYRRYGGRRSWNARQVVRALIDWQEATGAAPLAHEWAPGAARVMGLIGPEPQRWELEEPKWPSTHEVSRQLGSWSKALWAAGLPARRGLGPVPDLAERVAAARRGVEGGVPQRVIAEIIAVAPSTVTNYLRAGTCPHCGRPVTTAALGRGAQRCRSCSRR